MGFRPEPTVYSLVFGEDTPLHGLHVRASACSVKEYNSILKAAVGTESECIICEGDREIFDPVKDEKVECPACRGKGVIRGGINAQTLEDNDTILDLFANHLLSWDLEDLAGQAVPCSREGIDSQERGLVALVIQQWQAALVSVPKSSKTPSTTGSTSEEKSLNLGSISQSPPS